MTAFVHDLADLVRAGDPFGRFDRFSDGHLLRPYVPDAAARAEIPAGCDVPEVSRVDG